MSYWTYVNGVITVEPLGRTQLEKRYILDTVLNHLPKVTGSEQGMHIHVVQKSGYNYSSSCNEFGVYIPGEKYREQTEYMIVIEGKLRDRWFEETLKELNNWLNRLAKRVGVCDILVSLRGFDYVKSKKIIISDPKPYSQMEEYPSWSYGNTNGEPCWAEYLMWDSCRSSEYPMKLEYKYFDNPDNDAEVERRMKYERNED